MNLNGGKKHRLMVDEDLLRNESPNGAGRARLAGSIAEEFNARVGEVRQTYVAKLKQGKAVHRMEMAQQRIKLLEV